MIALLFVAAVFAQDDTNCIDVCPIVDDLDTAVESLQTFDYYNAPERLEDDYERAWDALPLEGRADRVPWTDTYWPETDGGIANRWQTGEHRGYHLHSQDELFDMSEDEIALLSPAEKYDLLVGNYQYTLTYRIQAQNGANESAWAGLCHGWTPASMHYEEPQPVVMYNPDGLVIPFGSADIKALLTYFDGEVVRNDRYPAASVPWATSPRVMGSLCLNDDPHNEACKDTNAGAFHIAMANQLGLRGEAFGIDATTTAEKWNQPVHAFYTELLGRRAPSEGASEHAVEELVVRSDVTWTVEVEPQWDPLLGTAGHEDVTKTYSYTLELNEQGEIVGGQWVLLLDGQQIITLDQAVDYLEGLDRDENGLPDHSEEQVKAIIWENFSFPDYVWKQDKVAFSDSFQQAWGPYQLLNNNQGTREQLFHYMAELGNLYEASVGGEG